MAAPLSSRLLFPLVERRFSYARYEDFVRRLAVRDVDVVRLRDLEAGRRDRPVVALRHDVDERLESAVRLAVIEHAHGIHATYFALHTAPYWPQADTVARLGEIQALGHELGFHNDLVTLERLGQVDTASYLGAALDRLRTGGLDIRGAAAHGSRWCHRLGFHNNYAFAGWDEPVPGFPSHDVARKLDPADYGLEYEAYHLPPHTYLSDAQFVGGRRWHVDDLDLEALEPGDVAIVNVHPCHWDASGVAKTARLARMVPQRLSDRARRPRELRFALLR
jgi:hypothetical protein